MKDQSALAANVVNSLPSHLGLKKEVEGHIQFTDGLVLNVIPIGRRLYEVHVLDGDPEWDHLAPDEQELWAEEEAEVVGDLLKLVQHLNKELKKMPRSLAYDLTHTDKVDEYLKSYNLPV